jgi:hypothetical protein
MPVKEAINAGIYSEHKEEQIAWSRPPSPKQLNTA